MVAIGGNRGGGVSSPGAQRTSATSARAAASTEPLSGRSLVGVVQRPRRVRPLERRRDATADLASPVARPSRPALVQRRTACPDPGCRPSPRQPAKQCTERDGRHPGTPDRRCRCQTRKGRRRRAPPSHPELSWQYSDSPSDYPSASGRGGLQPFDRVGSRLP